MAEFAQLTDHPVHRLSHVCLHLVDTPNHQSIALQIVLHVEVLPCGVAVKLHGATRLRLGGLTKFLIVKHSFISALELVRGQSSVSEVLNQLLLLLHFLSHSEHPLMVRQSVPRNLLGENLVALDFFEKCMRS